MKTKSSCVPRNYNVCYGIVCSISILDLHNAELFSSEPSHVEHVVFGSHLDGRCNIDGPR